MPVTRTADGWVANATRDVQWSAALLPGLLDLTPEEAPSLFGDLERSARRMVVVDEKVMGLYGHRILALLGRYGVEHNEPLVVPGGEAAKTRATVERVLDAMEDFGLGRFHEDLLLWGGGVLHDVGGVAAAEYRRGIAFRMYATTLVNTIDAMFALKCAVNDGYKNRRGHYYPAVASYADPAFFATLGRDQIMDGFGEILKWAIAGDGELFALLEAHGPRVAAEHCLSDDGPTREILDRTIGGMMGELAGNPWEANPARPSYIGHNWSPLFEPTVSHGQAVVLDILITTMIAVRRGLLRREERDRILSVTAAIGLKLWHEVLEQPERLAAAHADTIRHRGGEALVPTPTGNIGNVTFLNDITDEEIVQGVDDLYAIAGPARA